MQIVTEETICMKYHLFSEKNKKNDFKILPDEIFTQHP